MREGLNSNSFLLNKVGFYVMSWNWNVFLKSILLAFLGFLIGILSTIIYLAVDVDLSPLDGMFLINLYYYLIIFGLFCEIIGVFFVQFYDMAGELIENKIIPIFYKVFKKWSSGDIFGELKQYSSIIGFIFILIGFLLQIIAIIQLMQ